METQPAFKHDATELALVVRDWIDFLRIEKGASIHTVASYRRDIGGYTAYLEGIGRSSLREVTSDDLQNYIHEMRSGGKPSAPSSIARAASAIRSLHRFALKEGYLPIDVSTEMVLPKLPSKLPKALTIEQVSELLQAAHANDDPISLRDAALLELLYATGARISEAISLTADDVDLDAELPVVRLFGKGRKERLVPLGSYARDALAAYIVRARPVLALRGVGVSTLFLNKRGAALSRQSAWEAIHGYAQLLGIDEHVSPHTLRHSFATHLLEGGASVRDVQELLGHSSVQTTQIYTKMTATTLREVHRMTHPRAIG